MMTIVFVFFLVSSYVANVRTWALCFLLGVTVACLVSVFRKNVFLAKSVFLLLPVMAIFLTFVYLLSGLTSDLSAMGRIDQYIEITRMIMDIPAGLGFGDVGPKGSLSADSNILSLPLVFGVIGAILYMYVTIKIFFRLFDCFDIIFHVERTNVHYKVLYLSMLSYGASYLYVSAFQFSLFYGIQYLLFILIALLLTRLDQSKLSYANQIDLSH
jgi:hypothetical protein